MLMVVEYVLFLTLFLHSKLEHIKARMVGLLQKAIQMELMFFIMHFVY